MTLARWREFYEIEVTPMSLIFAAIVLILVCTHHHHVLFPLWIHVNTLNCYMVHLLIFEKDPLEPRSICTINHGKAFHAKVQYRLILLMSSDCCLGCLNPFPFQIFVPSIIMI